jgi:hypothetical protein
MFLRGTGFGITFAELPVLAVIWYENLFKLLDFRKFLGEFAVECG